MTLNNQQLKRLAILLIKQALAELKFEDVMLTPADHFELATFATRNNISDELFNKLEDTEETKRNLKLIKDCEESRKRSWAYIEKNYKFNT